MLAKIEGKRRRGSRGWDGPLSHWDPWLNGHEFWSKLQKVVKDRGIWHTEVRRVPKSQIQLSHWTTIMISPFSLKILFFLIIFLMKDNCFTEFRCFRSNLNMNHLPFEPPSHLPPHPTPLGWYRTPVWVSWAIQQIPISYLFYIWECKFPCHSFHTSHPLLPHVHKSILYVCFSTAAL